MTSLGGASDHVWFIVVNYFGSESIAPLVDSLVRQTSRDWSVTIVDNSVSTAERSRLASLTVDDTRFAVWNPGQNLGYFGGALWAMKRDNRSFGWLVVCNADVELGNERFVADLQGRENRDQVIAPRVQALPSGRDQNPYMLARPKRRSVLRWRLVLAHYWTARLAYAFARNRRNGAPQTARRIYAAHGSFIIFGSGYFTRGGSLLHPTFLFNEEISVAETCRRQGTPVCYSPGLSVMHSEHQATGNYRSKEVWRMQRDASNYAYDLLYGKHPEGSIRFAATRRRS